MNLEHGGGLRVMAVDQATESHTESRTAIKQNAQGHYICPECGATKGERTGKPFENRGSISSHRRRAHQVRSEGWRDQPKPIRRSRNSKARRNGKDKALVLKGGALETQFCFMPLGTPDGAHLIVQPDARNPKIAMGFIELAQVGSGFMGNLRMKNYRGGNHR